MQLHPRIVMPLLAALLLAAPAQAQKTEVTVAKGKVKADAPTGSVVVEPGQKAVLETDKQPVVATDEPLVQQLIELDEYVQEEKAARQAAGQRVDHGGVGLGSIEADGSFRGASLYPMTNRGQQPTRRLRIGPTMRQSSAAYYTGSGKLIPVDIEKAGEQTDYHYLNFEQPIPPGGSVNVISIGSIPASREILCQEGKLWYMILGDGSRFALGYRRITLPKSAILVDSTIAPTEVTTVNGRILLTFRKCSDADGSDGSYWIAFLWPDRDGSSLADLPEYRGLTDSRDEALAAEYAQGMQKIRQGEVYQDQSTPIRCLLTWHCGVLRRDAALCGQVHIPHDIKDYLRKSPDSWDHFRNGVDEMALLTTPPWPEAPEEGYVHPIYMRGAGRIRIATIATVYKDGKWQHLETKMQHQPVDMSIFRH